MTVPVISHEEAEAVGVLLRRRINGGRACPADADTLGWADIVQFVLLQAREVVAALEAQVERAQRDSEVSRAPSTRTLAELKGEIRMMTGEPIR